VHQLLMDIKSVLEKTEADIRHALQVASLEHVNRRHKECKTLYENGKKYYEQRKRRNSVPLSPILPRNVPEPRLRKDTNWDVLGGSFSVKKGKFTKVSRRGIKSKYTFWLFTNVLLYGTHDNYQWKTRKVIEIDESFSVKSEKSSYPNAFRIITPSKSFLAFTDTPEEKSSWLQAFNSVLWKVVFDPLVQPKLSQTPRRQSFTTDVCEMETCSNSISGTQKAKEFLLSWSQRCAFCGKCVCSECGKYQLPWPRKRLEAQKACVRCYFKVLKYPRIQKRNNIFPHGHYLALKDKIPIRRLDSVNSENLGWIRQGDIVHVTECRFASARIHSPRNGYIPLTMKGDDVGAGDEVLCHWDVNEWDVKTTCLFMKIAVHLKERQIAKFRELKISGEDLISLSEEKLDFSLERDFGISNLMVRKRFISKLNKFRAAGETHRREQRYDTACNSDNISECGESRSSYVEETSDGEKRHMHHFSEGVSSSTVPAPDVPDIYLGPVYA